MKRLSSILKLTIIVGSALVCASCVRDRWQRQEKESFFNSIKELIYSDYDDALQRLEYEAGNALKGLDAFEYASKLEDISCKLALYQDSLQALKREAAIRVYDSLEVRYRAKGINGEWTHQDSINKERGKGFYTCYTFDNCQVQVWFDMRTDTCFSAHTYRRHGGPYAPEIAQIDTLLAEKIADFELGKHSIGPGVTIGGDYTKKHLAFEWTIDAIEEVCRRNEAQKRNAVKY